ncbi:hypothetical protein NPX13_g390 [Xylaria arbuscula]|uniref:BZIP domain-containing protein n=1 Tax=Xylaria arbuscula TaxID=114810 RepID=A0A9W8NMZ0_9PEZI|nr:hypothetical protein NPX13_g390 [Xylaria arbuscula]
METPRDETLERRRLQNRIAQQRFRRRHNGHKEKQIIHNDWPETTRPHESVSLPTPSSLPLPVDIVPSSQSLQWSTLTDTAPPFDALIDQGLDEGPTLTDSPTYNGITTLPFDDSNLEIADNSPPEPRLVDRNAPKCPPTPSAVFGDIPGELREEPRGWLRPLHVAAQKGHGAIVRLLVQHSTDCDERDSDGMTALMHAVIGDHKDVVLSLLSNGASVSVLDKQRRSTLHWAALHRREALLGVLLSHYRPEIHGSIDVYDSDMRTPLHTAVYVGFDAGVELLLTFGANASLKVWNNTK